MKNKFLIEKDYNISIIAEGLDINEANLEFCLLLDEFKLSIPLKNIKENVFRLRLPSKIKNSITNSNNIQYSINALKDNLIFEVAKAKFDLELFAVKAVSIDEAVDEVEDIVIKTESIVIEEDISPTPSKPNKKEIVQSLIENIINKKA